MSQHQFEWEPDTIADYVLVILLCMLALPILCMIILGMSVLIGIRFNIPIDF